MTSSRVSEFLSGVRSELPILIGVAPFGMIYGVLALDAGIPPGMAQAMSAVVFAGSSQMILTQLVHQSTPAMVMILTVFVVNLRHALYSASLAPYVQHLPARWKILLSYLLTDEAYAVTVIHYEELDSLAQSGEISSRKLMRPAHWFYLGAGLALWSTWQLSTAAGIFLGAVVPESWSLDFTLALTFIALVIPNLKDRPGVAAALVAGVTSILTYNIPYKLGLIAAALAGVIAGLWVEMRTAENNQSPTKEVGP
jgi:predicted branched-subunit amino acid permease